MNTVYCIGRNYVKHALELGNEVPGSPVVFLKSPSSLRGLTGPLAFPDEDFHHEIELVLKIGKDFKLGEIVTHSDIEAIALGIDLTRREVQNELKKKGLPWTLSKSFAGSAILGEMRPYQNKAYTFELFVNGELRQRGDTRNMVFSFIELASFINTFSPLKKGDLIYTGTPEGVNVIRRGDMFELVLNETNREQGVL